jgi:hypothetical protein
MVGYGSVVMNVKAWGGRFGFGWWEEEGWLGVTRVMHLGVKSMPFNREGKDVYMVHACTTALAEPIREVIEQHVRNGAKRRPLASRK